MTKHPKGLYLLFAVEMWERFSFYGMRALLVLFMVKYFLFSTESAGKIYGWYLGLVYMTPLIGGYIADRYWGNRRCIYVGGTLMALAQFALAFKTHVMFFLGLCLLIIGCGFFKPNISTMVGELYERNDPRRDSAFTIFYMGINIGAAIAPLLCGYLGERYDWSYGFIAAGVGMLLGMSILKWGQDRYLGKIGSAPAGRACAKEDAAPLTKEDKQRIAVIFLLEFFMIFFWSAYEQAGSSLTLFADAETNRKIFGWEVPSSWFVSLSAVFVVLLAPFFSKLWLALADRKSEPSTPAKFAWALGLLGLAFVVMSAAAKLYQTSGPVSMLWLTTAYLLMVMGELCLSPVGLSMVTKLSPSRFVTLLMGTWFFATGGANLTSGLFAANYDKMPHWIFYLIPAMAAFGGAIALGFLVKPVRRWMHGIN